MVRNRASEVARPAGGHFEAHDVEAVAATFSDQAVYDDRRSIGGAPLQVRVGRAKAAERAIADYPHAVADPRRAGHTGAAAWSLVG